MNFRHGTAAHALQRTPRESAVLRRCRAAALVSALLAGCYAADAVNKNYDLSKVRRIGIIAFDYGRHPRFGAEDMFAKQLLERGYQVVERTRLETILQEQNLSAAGLLSRDTAKGLGGILGVDAVLLGQVTNYEPERKTLVMVDSHSRHEEPVFAMKKVKQPDGKMAEVQYQIGKRVTEQRKQIPFMLPVEAEVGLAVKLVDVESGEMVWVGSDTNQAVNGAVATEWIASYLVKRLSKKWTPRR